MANKKSAIKQMRSANSKRLRNRYQLKTYRTFAKRLRTIQDKKVGEEWLQRASSMLDKLAKRHIIHKNKAANSKSTLAKYVSGLV